MDVLELGVPFSDPLADGLVNQLAAQRGLESGATPPKVLETVAAIRRESQIPIVLYIYFNLIHRHGVERFIRDAAQAGVDGLLVLDLPPEESDDYEALMRQAGLCNIYLVAPTTPEDRIELIVKRGAGFIYYVSREGVTGMQTKVADTIAQMTAKIRAHTALPIAVGFGISTPEQAKIVAASAEAVVVGSAIVNQIARHGKAPDLVKRVSEFVKSLVASGEETMKAKPDTNERFVIIMAGGRGERFWPVSREKMPKQLITLLGDRSFLQQAVDRVLPLVPIKNILVITNEVQAPEVRKQLPKLPKENVIAEPIGRDTCAAVTLGAALVGARSTTGVMAVLPADHVIPEEKKFQQVLSDAFDLAGRGQAIITIGIKPTEPATGYGYIRVGETLPPPQGVKPYKTALPPRRAVRRKAALRQGARIPQQRPVPLERGHVHLVVRHHHRRIAEAPAGDVCGLPALVQSGGEPGQARQGPRQGISRPQESLH